jgi:polyhydroxyalkanoate synthesis regulator phasin
MTKTRPMLVLAVALLATAVLGATAGTAAAHRGPGLGKTSTTKLVNTAAKELGVTSAALKAAIQKSAAAQVDAAVEDGDVESDEASDLKDETADDLDLAYRLSRASTVASNLGITTTKLNDGFRAARKTIILARIDEAVADGDIDADQAADLKSELEDTTLPGYKQSSLTSLGLGYGFGYHGGHH